MLEMEPFGTLGHARYREYARDIRTSGAHLLQLINDILDLSRVAAGEVSLSDDDIDVTWLYSQAKIRPAGEHLQLSSLVAVSDEQDKAYIFSSNHCGLQTG